MNCKVVFRVFFKRNPEDFRQNFLLKKNSRDAREYWTTQIVEIVETYQSFLETSGEINYYMQFMFDKIDFHANVYHMVGT